MCELKRYEANRIQAAKRKNKNRLRSKLKKQQAKHLKRMKGKQ